VILLSAFRQQVDYLITADNNELPLLARNSAVKGAVERYGRDRPYIHADDVTGTASHFYPIATALPSWVEGFSRVESIEYPAHALADNARPQYLQPLDFIDDYLIADVRYLYLPNHAPAATETLRVTYSVPWTWAASTTLTNVTQAAHGFAVNDYVYYNSAGDTDYLWKKASHPSLGTHRVTAVTAATPPAVSGAFVCAELQVGVREEHFNAVCYLAAAGCCRALATKYALGSDSTIGADSVQRTNNAGEFARRADEFVALYEQGIGSGKTVAPSRAYGQFVEMFPEAGWPGNRDFMFHGRRTRRGSGHQP
jgi:hypothetical protein